jgi:branched-chain amino acid aminotransferase
VFSTIRICRGVLFAFERHYARMKRDAENLRVPMPDAHWLRERLLTLIAANAAADSTLRVAVVRNRGGIWAGPATRDFDVLALTADLSDWGESVRLGVVAHGRYAQSRFAGAKITSWGANLCWYEEAHLDGFDEVVLLNEWGQVSECTSANIFAAAGNEVWTPPLTSGCLPGVTRELLLHEIPVEGLTVVERDLTLDDLQSADEVFITSTTRNLLPAVHVEGLSIQPGSRACDALRMELQRYIDAYVEAELTGRRQETIRC